jgi:putative aminopeptidase FrvX
MVNIDKLLETLTNATGVGYQGNVADIVCRELKKHGIDTRKEKDGSVCGSLKGTTEYGLMLACHIDEIGFIVDSIDDAGRLGFSMIGGSDVSILPGQEVMVHGKKPVPGYIGAKPPHLIHQKERKKIQPLEKLFVDTGLPAEAAKNMFKIGDCISFINKYQKLQGELRTAKSLDNRASVACGILVMRELSKYRNDFNIYFVATSQEEFSGLGARIHAHRLPVDFSIVVDVSLAEYPGLKSHEFFPLNSGPEIGRGATIPAKLSDLLIKTAQQYKIPYQIEPMPTYTGTDADGIAFSRAGIATCTVGIPLRYMHTPVEVVSLKDIRHARDLIVHFIRKLMKNEKDQLGLTRLKDG